MTPEKFIEWASAEKALADQMRVTGQTVTQDTLTGCLMAAVQIARHLKLSEADSLKQLESSWQEHEQYVDAKKRIADKRRQAK